MDDDERLIDVVGTMLSDRGVHMKAAEAFDKEINLVEEIKPDLIVLNTDSVGLSSREVLQRLRVSYGYYPGIILLTWGGDKAKTLALESGADDCLGKPFRPAELVARICAVLRRIWLQSGGYQAQMIRIGDVEIDPYRRVIRKNGEIITHWWTEWLIVQLFVSNPDRVLSEEKILTNVWGDDYSKDFNYYHTWIVSLAENKA